jgi:hypothetical protein
MRYAADEENIIVGIFPTNSSVTIKLINLITDAEVALINNGCAESLVVEGIYRWSTNNIINNENYLYDYVNLLAVMSDTNGNKDYSKFIYGGFPDTIDLIMSTK